MKHNILFIAFAGILFYVAGCNKSTPGYTFENHQGVPVTVAIYGSETDYLNNRNAIMSTQISANSDAKIPVSKLTKGSWYYMDINSDDYTYTNWVLDDDFIIGQDSITARRFKYTGATANVVAQTEQTNARISLLEITKVSTTWKAVDALDLTSNASIWNSLSAEEQFAKVTVSKDHTGTYYVLSGSDTAAAQFTFNSVDGYPVYNLLINETGLNFFMVNTTVNPSTSSYEPASITSAVVLLNGYLYIMQRQD